MGAFLNELKAGHFNESIAQKPILTLVEVVAREKCYIKGEEKNVEKKAHDAMKHVLGTVSSYPSRKNNYTLHVKDKSLFKRTRKTTESFTPLNIPQEHIWHEVFHLHNI